LVVIGIKGTFAFSHSEGFHCNAHPHKESYFCIPL
jgi:hypothetical protein